MAVSKMEKMTIIAAAEKEAAILQAIQGLQIVEVKRIFHSPEEEQALKSQYSFLQAEQSTEQLRKYETMLQQLQELLLFLTRSSGKGLKIKRKVYTLEELEQTFDEETLQSYLTELKNIQESLKQIQTDRQGLEAEEELLGRWQYLDILPHKQQLKSSYVVHGSINLANKASFLSALSQWPTVYFEEIYQSMHHSYFTLVYLKEHQQSVTELLNQYSFEPLQYRYDVPPKEAYQQVKERYEILQKEEKALKQQLASYHDFYETFCLAEEVLLAIIQREQARQHLLNASSFFILQTWIPVEEKAEILTAIEEKVPKDEIALTFENPTKAEIETDIPVKLANNKLVQPFEMLTEMYSLPKYEEVDPTPAMMPFYLVFFGMMVADIGYGLLMLLLSIIALKAFVLPRGMKRFADFFLILSFPTIIWGFIYGSFFGAALPPIMFGIKSPFPILSTTEDVNTILILSVIFGFIQLVVGLMINGIQLSKQKRYLDSINESYAWLGILFGLALLVVGKLVVKNEGLFTAGAILASLSAIAIIVIPMIQSKAKLKGLAKGLYGLYGVTGYVGDLVSYTRLMALGIAGGSIASAFNMLVEFMPPVARFSVGILLLIVLHALNIFLSLLGAYVHGARLQYVEFFGKFYTGGGRAFNPLKTKEKYVNVEKK
ncbi:V-type ATP synthase subunit I [Enterococcus faecalis]|nr:V-type ATP synthase subunit I [Enterococcus faecalis]